MRRSGHPDDDPINITALQADAALLDALSAGDLGAAAKLADPHDPLIALLSGWIAHARAEAPVAAAAAAAAKAAEPGSVPAATRSGAASAVSQPHTAISIPAVPHPAPHTAVSDVAAPTGSTASYPAVEPITAPIAIVRPPQQPQLLVRLVAAAVLAVLVLSGTTVGTMEAVPGDPLWTLSKALDSNRAKSVEAAVTMRARLASVRTALSEGRKEDAQQEVMTIDAVLLPAVRAEDGHAELDRECQSLADLAGVRRAVTTDSPLAAGSASNPAPAPAPAAILAAPANAPPAETSTAAGAAGERPANIAPPARPPGPESLTPTLIVASPAGAGAQPSGTPSIGGAPAGIITTTIIATPPASTTSTGPTTAPSPAPTSPTTEPVAPPPPPTTGPASPPPPTTEPTSPPTSTPEPTRTPALLPPGPAPS